jgi:hypothetical protein
VRRTRHVENEAENDAENEAKNHAENANETTRRVAGQTCRFTVSLHLEW